MRHPSRVSSVLWLVIAGASAACAGDPVGGTGVRADPNADIGSSTPSSFIPQAPTAPAPATPSAPSGPAPGSEAGSGGDGDGAGGNAADSGDDTGTDPLEDPGDPGADTAGRAPIPICEDTDDDAGVPSQAGCAVVGDLVVQYRAGDTDPADNQIRAQFNLLNTGSTAIPLSELTIRYWYTKETTEPSQEFHCDYARIGSSLVQGSFAATELPGADHYLEVSFTGGMLPAGGDSGEIQTRFNTVGWADYDETDDYSYDGTITEYTDWDRATLYLNGALIWGAEPHD